jgi:excisionase family DNA binding protein
MLFWSLTVFSLIKEYNLKSTKRSKETPLMLAEKKIFLGRTSHIASSMTMGENDSDSDSDSNDLLDVYLTLPHKQREQRFADTASAARITGLTQRTIQLWIEFGAIRAIPIGRKYKIDLESLKAYLKSRVELQA